MSVAWNEDAEGRWEKRTEILAVALCPICGEDVNLEAETEGWIESAEGSGIFLHDGFGPAMGECCGKVIADWWEGTFAFDAPASPRES